MSIRSITNRSSVTAIYLAQTVGGGSLHHAEQYYNVQDLKNTLIN